MDSVSTTTGGRSGDTAGTPPAAPPTPPRVSLRPLIGSRASSAFAATTADGGRRLSVADVLVDSYEIDLRMAAMHRALVAHQAINKLLSELEMPDLPSTLLGSIEKAEELDLVDNRERRWLRHINREANDAKHGRPLPF